MKNLVTKTQVKLQGYWPDYFLQNLVSEVPDVKVSSNNILVWDCPTHGQYQMRIIDKLNGKHCPLCKDIISRNSLYQTLRSRNPFPQWFIDDLEGSPDKDKVLSGELRTCDNALFNCKIHGFYLQRINDHLNRGTSCPICGVRKNTVNRVISHRKRVPFSKEFLERLEGSPDKDKVLNWEVCSHDKVTLFCRDHGYYSILVGDIWKRGCPKCGILKGHKKIALNCRRNNPIPDFIFKDLEGSPDYERVKNCDFTSNDLLRFVCKKHGFYQQRLHDHWKGKGCPTCAAENRGFVSSYELCLRNDLILRGVNFIGSCRNVVRSISTGRTLELDLYLQDFNIAIEVDGLYWHSYEHMSSQESRYTASSPELYHYEKYLACKDQGIQLINLFEDDLRDRYDVCLNLILSKCGLLKRQKIAARKCKVDIISSTLAGEFYNKYHIQGYGQGKHYALFYEVDGKDVLVSCLSVRRSDSNECDAGSFELNRYATHNDYFVIGGLERLMSHAEKDLNIHRWISYADLTVSNGSLYYHNGWKEIGFVKPDYKYVYKGKRYHKFNFRIKRFREDPDLKFEEGLTESQLAELNGLTRIYDCGKLKFEKLLLMFRNNQFK